MRIVVTGDSYLEEVEAESFEIEGSSEKFAVHPAITCDVLPRGAWTATHIETGLSVGRGATRDAAITSARAAWAAATPAQREMAKIQGMRTRAARQLTKCMEPQ